MSVASLLFATTTGLLGATPMPERLAFETLGPAANAAAAPYRSTYPGPLADPVGESWPRMAAVRTPEPSPGSQQRRAFPQLDKRVLLVFVVLPAFALLLRALLMGPGPRSAQRLRELYPAAPAAPGARWTYRRVVFGNGPRMTWVRLTADHAYLHVSVVGGLRARRGFSVPLADVSATPARFPLMVLAPDVVRLSFARDPSLPVILWPHVFRRLVEASGGRLRLTEPTASAPHASDARR
jgi:hypothetical protein